MCRHQADCVRGTRARRSLTLRTHEQHIALMAARRRGTTAEFAALSAVRAGVEGTISQAVRGFGLRRSRYVGQAKAHLQHVATAAAMNLVRMTEWLGGADLATTRRQLVARIDGVGALSPMRVPGHAMRTYSGRPSSSIRFSTSAAIATS